MVRDFEMTQRSQKQLSSLHMELKVLGRCVHVQFLHSCLLSIPNVCGVQDIHREVACV